MAVVDTQTGRIVGCEEGSWTWWHEKGHIEFNKDPKGFQYGYMWMFSIFCAVVLWAIYTAFQHTIIYIMFLAMVGLAIYYYAYEEIWCWVYAIRNRGKKQEEAEDKEAKGISIQKEIIKEGEGK